MSKFNFAHLLGFKPADPAAAKDDDDKKDGSATELIESKENEDEGDDADAGKADKASKASLKAAVAGERTRCAAIFAAPEAAGRVAAAAHLAFNTDLSADAAIGALKAMPAGASSGSALDRAMSQVQQPKVGSDATDPAAGNHGWDAVTDRVNQRFGARRK